MMNSEFISIDAMNVSKNQPFVIYPGLPRNTSEFQLSESGKSDNMGRNFSQNLTDFAKTLFHSPVEEIPEIDQQMLRFRSVSSLRDFKLFSPPAPSYAQNKDAAVFTKGKKTLFINEFPLFEYERT